MNIVEYPTKDKWDDLIRRPDQQADEIEERVKYILNEVKSKGDDALYAFSKQFDQVDLEQLHVDPAEIVAGYERTSSDLIEAMQLAADNISAFHKQQHMNTSGLETSPGVRCWQKSLPIERVGIYVPGGTAPLFSSLLMLGIPAKIAGCESITVCSPPDISGQIHSSILAAAHISGIDQVFKIGGAQAVAALAYGTESIPQVYKIFGPGNRYVTLAKQMISMSAVAIDMPAGPSEVAVIADKTSEAEFIVWDLLSQAEHGSDSQVILVTDSPELAQKVLEGVKKTLLQLPRRSMARGAIEASHIIIMRTIEDGLDFINRYAPEHLIINTKNAQDLANAVRNAGSVFIGPYAPESAGDYASGTNHTLPTNAAARAFSGVMLESFKKTITFQQISRKGLGKIGPAIERMATEEGLEAHRRAVAVRLQKD